MRKPYFCQMVSEQNITTATGQDGQVLGTVQAKLSIQDYRTNMRFLVVPMAPDIDAIVGEPWFKSSKAVLQYGKSGLEQVRVFKGKTLRKLVQPTTSPMDIDKQPLKIKNKLISHAQFTRATKTCQYFVARVSLAPKKGEDKTDKTETDKTETKTEKQPSLASEQKTKVDGTQLKALLDEFDIVFQPLPKELPPFRDDTGHTIPLQPGASPPYRPAYRFSPLELREVRKQLQELLENKFIQPSRSPYGAPVLFV